MTSAIPRITVRYWAGARAVAGLSEEQVDATSLADVLRQVCAEHGPELTRVLTVCSFVVSERPVGRTDPAEVPLTEGDVVEVLPPFAGGARA